MAYDLLASVVGPSRDFFPKAKDAALRALSLDDTLADPALVLADVFFAYEWNFESGVNEFKRLFELYPNHAMAHAWYASNIAHIDRKDEVLYHCARALELDPLNNTVVGWTFNALITARQYEKSVELAQGMIARDPKKSETHLWASMGLMEQGKLEEGSAEYRKAIDAGYREHPLDRIWLAAKSGKKSEAGKRLDEYVQANRGKKINLAEGVNLSRYYSFIGDKEKAFQWLEWLYEERSSSLGLLEAVSDFDNLRSDPRYEILVKKIRGKK